MSSGVILQLNHTGLQDKYLTDDPQISLFRCVYERHTNYSMQDITQSFPSTPKLGETIKIKVNKSGDLITNMCLYLNLNYKNEDTTEYIQSRLVNNFGLNMIEYVEIFIGEERIDRHYTDWFNIYLELTNSESDNKNLDTLMNGNNIFNIYRNHEEIEITDTIEAYIPLHFWFCRYNNLPLPIIAMRNQDIYLQIKFREASKLIHIKKKIAQTTPYTNPSLTFNDSSGLICNYIYLDNKDRLFFAQKEHNIFIEQVQYMMNENIIPDQVNKKQLTFNHPTKALFWVHHQNNYINSSKNHSYYFDHNLFDNKSNLEIDELKLKSYIINYWLQISGGGGVFHSSAEQNLAINPTTYELTVAGDGGPLTLSTFNKLFEFYIDEKLYTFEKYYQHHNVHIKQFFNSIKIRSGVSGKNIDNEHIVLPHHIPHSVKVLLNIILAQEIKYHDTSNTNKAYIYEVVYPSYKQPGNENINLYLHIEHNHNIYSVYPKSEINPTKNVQLTINGLNRTENHGGKYYNYLQPYNNNCFQPHTGINMYSFSQKPFDYKPTGTCNLSKLNNVYMNYTPNNSVGEGYLNIFALNYNIFNIKNGYCNLSFMS